MAWNKKEIDTGAELAKLSGQDLYNNVDGKGMDLFIESDDYGNGSDDFYNGLQQGKAQPPAKRKNSGGAFAAKKKKSSGGGKIMMQPQSSSTNAITTKNVDGRQIIVNENRTVKVDSKYHSAGDHVVEVVGTTVTGTKEVAIKSLSILELLVGMVANPIGSITLPNIQNFTESFAENGKEIGMGIGAVGIGFAVAVFFVLLALFSLEALGVTSFGLFENLANLNR